MGSPVQPWDSISMCGHGRGSRKICGISEGSSPVEVQISNQGQVELLIGRGSNGEAWFSAGIGNKGRETGRVIRGLFGRGISSVFVTGAKVYRIESSDANSRDESIKSN
jgi:hypothetical protein